MDALLAWLLLIPLIGAAIGALLPGGRSARTWALVVSLATFMVSVLLLAQMNLRYDPAQAAALSRLDQSFQLRLIPGPNSPLKLERIGASISLGADTISAWLALLTTFLTPLAILSSWKSIKDRAKEYYAWMLLLLFAMLGVFVSRDLLLFYVFFELTLVPMFFIIGIWGGPQRRYAAGKFFLFTFAGSIFTLAGVIYLGLTAGSFDLVDIIRHAQNELTGTQRYWLFLAFLAGFAVKVPLFPVHTWLPLAHTEAPTAGSVILAGVLLKLGTYGLLRLAVPVGLPDVTVEMTRFLGLLCLIGILYGALVAWVQQDIKKLVAYSSVSHLGFCVLGLLALNVHGVQGSVLYMINHGLSTGALFLVIGMIYDRHHTRDIHELSGLARRMPKLAFFFVLFALSSIGLPGLNGFVSEFLTILGAFTSKHLGIAYGSLAALGIILGAVYTLHMVARVIWGPLKIPHGGEHGDHETADERELGRDIGPREVGLLIPLAAAVVILGVLPYQTILRSIEGSAALVTQIVPALPKPIAAVRLSGSADASSALSCRLAGETPVPLALSEAQP